MATPTALRPLSIGEILDAAVKVVLRYWKTLIKCTVGLILPVEIAQTLVLASVSPNRLKLLPDTERTSTQPQVDWGALGGILISSLIVAILFLVVYTTCFKAVSDAWLGVEPKAGRSLRFGLRRFPSVFLLWLVWEPLVLLGMIPLFVLAGWLVVIWALSLPALLFERRGPFKALARSYELVSGRFWATALLVLVGYVAVSVVGGIFQFILLGATSLASHDNEIANGVVQVIGGTAVSAVTMPYLTAVLTILYFDQRVRKEGFDLQLMAEGLGTERDPDGPLPEPLIGSLPAPRGTWPQQQQQGWGPPPQPGWGQPPPQQQAWGQPSQPPASYGGWAPPQPGPGQASPWPAQPPEAEQSPPQEPPAGGSWAPPVPPRDDEGS